MRQSIRTEDEQHGQPTPGVEGCSAPPGRCIPLRRAPWRAGGRRVAASLPEGIRGQAGPAYTATGFSPLEPAAQTAPERLRFGRVISLPAGALPVEDTYTVYAKNLPRSGVPALRRRTMCGINPPIRRASSGFQLQSETATIGHSGSGALRPRRLAEPRLPVSPRHLFLSLSVESLPRPRWSPWPWSLPNASGAECVQRCGPGLFQKLTGAMSFSSRRPFAGEAHGA